MRAIKASVTRGLQKNTVVAVCDNSGAKLIRVISFKTYKGCKGRHPSGGIASMITGSVIKGNLDMRKKVVQAIVVRQTKEFRRPSGLRVKFEDNAVVVVKDLKGNPKGTLIKGPIAKEAAQRWTPISKVAKIQV
jgi:large subunit ribosomal protein L14